MTKTKNKHGRIGVKRYSPKIPLTDAQRTEVRRLGKEEGYKLGRKAGRADVLGFLNSLIVSKNIKEVRSRIKEWINE